MLALYRDVSGKLEPVREEVFKSREFPKFEQVMARFLDKKESGQVTAICLGVAGAVKDGRSKTTNLPWVLDEQELAREFNVKKVRLLNDLEAAAFGMLFLAENEMAVLSQGKDTKRKSNIAVIAAGRLSEPIPVRDASLERIGLLMGGVSSARSSAPTA